MYDRRRFVKTVLFGGIVAYLPVGCNRPSSVWAGAEGTKIAVSFAPLYSFAANVAGPTATIRSALGNEGPHHADLTTASAEVVAGAELFFVNGLGLDERVAKKMIKASGNSRVKLIDIGSQLNPDLLLEGEFCCLHDHDHDHDHHHHDHDHEDIDPHVWLGIEQAIAMVEVMRDSLKEFDSANAEEYCNNSDNYVDTLKKIQEEGLEKLKDKKERKFVTFHGSLTYFANTFGLAIADVIQKIPGKDPTNKEIDKLVKICLEEKVRVIAVEPQYTSQTSALRLKEELEKKGIEDVALIEIDPLETANPDDMSADWYERKMRANIDTFANTLR